MNLRDRPRVVGLLPAKSLRMHARWAGYGESRISRTRHAF